MSLPRTAAELVPGDVEGLLAAAATHRSFAAHVGDTHKQLAAAVTGSAAYWSGPASNGFRTAGTRQATTLAGLVPLATDAAGAYATLGAALRDLRSQADGVLRQAQELGLPAGALTSDAAAVVAHLLRHPEHAVAIARLLALIVMIRVRVGEAHNAFVVAIARTGTRLREREDELRAPDERGGRRIRTDSLTRRDEPGSDHLSNDWAGRAILERYLRGGGDWTIDGDADWTSYMEKNETLRLAMAERTQTAAQDALNRYVTTGQTQGSFDSTFSQAIENGEGIVGYQYLHGTNAEAGGFRHSGSTTVTPLDDGTYRVQLNSSYQWNDVIDPNPQYSTDRWKSRLAEVLTLGQADPYDIHIRWSEPVTVVLDAQGNLVSMDGYPG